MNANLAFLIDTTLLISALLYTLRILYLRAKPDSVLHKYKSNTETYKTVKANLHKALSLKRLSIVLAAATLIAIKTIFDTKNIYNEYGDGAPGRIVFMLIFTALMWSVVGAAVILTLKYKDNTQK